MDMWGEGTLQPKPGRGFGVCGLGCGASGVELRAWLVRFALSGPEDSPC